MHIGGNKTRLIGLTRELFSRWEQTKYHWRDAKAEEFEAKHLNELSAQVDRAVIMIDKLEELLKKVRRDCE